MDELRLELRTRNNVLWHAIYDYSPSIAAFCREHHLKDSLKVVVCSYLNLTRSPYLKTRGRADQLTRAARQLCELTGMGRDELFPPALYTGRIPAKQIAEVSVALLPLAAARTVAALPANFEDQLDAERLSSLMSGALETLKPKEVLVLKRRFGFDGTEPKTFADIAYELGLCQERIRQIEAAALRKLRHPSRSRQLRAFLERLPDVEPAPKEDQKEGKP